ncbi:MAG: response regulator [Myxococcota bacterium]|nr:response regulator [Myxococcota bacterium]
MLEITRPIAAPIPRARLILVVDDHEDVRELVAEVLRGHGTQVAAVPSVAAALEVLGTLAVDVVVTDFSMPGASGLDLLREMRDDPRWSRIPAVLISAHEDRQELQRQAFLVGAEFLSKPFAFDDLERAIGALCARDADAARVEVPAED